MLLLPKRLHLDCLTFRTSSVMRITAVDSIWNAMAHGDAREGKWRGNWRMEWAASTLHTTSELCVSSITTADAHTSTAISRLNWLPCRFKWTRLFRRKTKSGVCACAITFQTQSTSYTVTCSARVNRLSVFRSGERRGQNPLLLFCHEKHFLDNSDSWLRWRGLSQWITVGRGRMHRVSRIRTGD